MPEAIVTQQTLIRVLDEAIGPVEATPLNILESDALVRIINELIGPVETEGTTDIEWNFAQRSTINVPETTFRVLGVPVPEGIIKIISEAVNVVEAINLVLGVPPAPGISKVINEAVSIVEIQVTQSVLVRVITNRIQVAEDIVRDVANVVVKIIDETVNVVEGAVDAVIPITLEIVKVISEVVKVVESQIPPVKGLVQIINEQALIGEVELNLVYVIGQLSGLFRLSPRLQAIFRINQDTEQ